jgi:mono/diheme cytochrome c family protein
VVRGCPLFFSGLRCPHAQSRPLTVCSVVLASGLTAALARIGVVSAQGPAPSATPVSFNREILPILANNCFACHGPDEKKRETKFHFDTQEGMFLKKGVIEPGNAEESLLIEKITEPDPKERMPPLESGHALTDKQIGLLRRWIDEGATWDTHWAYVPPKRPELPRGQSDLVGSQSHRSVHPRASGT